VNNPAQQPEWEPGWDGHERAQRRRLAQLSLSEKLKWLEEAHDLVRRLQGQMPGRTRPAVNADDDQ
jgi:hypothetical protein